MTGKQKPAAVTAGREWGGGQATHSEDHNTTGGAARQSPARQVLWAGSKHTASIDPDGVLRKTARSRHMLRTPRAWAFDEAHIAAAQRTGVLRVEVFDTDTQTTYRAAVADFETFGIRLDRGYGPQIALPLARWQTSGADDARQPAQLALF